MARLKGFEKLTSVDEALRVYFETVKPKRLGAVMVPLHEALNRIAAQDIIAEKDLPSFNRSAVDGYAVKATDTMNATQFNPKILQITSDETIRKGEAKIIWTGKPLPSGADAVIMLEHVKRLDHKIRVETQVTPGENVSKKGEDIQKGQVAVKAGTRLKPQHLGLLAALEYALVSVVEKPRIAILATGNELVKLGKKPKTNQIIDTNHFVLSSMCHELGADTVDLGISKDNETEIGSKIKQGLEKAHMILTTGGTSTGESDLVPLVISKLGKPGIIVHGIAMRPGMPTALALVNAKPVVVLSGNPVAAMIGFEVFVRPMILSMLGVENEQRHIVKARLTRRVAGALGRRVFLRVLVSFNDNEFFAEPIRVTGSGMLSTMTRANGYVVIPENREGLEEGEVVLVHLFDNVKIGE
ncbi:MAG: molybdopterin molybdotransferase MoeA [Candidatus Bathyarchaeales archaeon]